MKYFCLPENLPRHVGIIMDGNGRWAKLRGLPRLEGHRRGAERAKEIIQAARNLGIGALTLYTFSLENWQRPSAEITFLMKLLELYLLEEMHEFKKQEINFRFIGDLNRLPKNLRRLVKQTEDLTSDCKEMVLTAAISYSGRDEILRAVKQDVACGIGPKDIDEKLFSSFLDTAGLPDPDLIIRTSGEKRISNFLLWQSAYSEFYFTNTLWPDFGEEQFFRALTDYQAHYNKFGTAKIYPVSKIITQEWTVPYLRAFIAYA